MTRRAEKHYGDDATTQFPPVTQDDAFLDALSRGEDPSGGADPLAALLLGLKHEVDRPMPAAPEIIVAAPAAEEVPAEQTVVSLDEARERRRGMNPWVSGLIGAAAATVVVAGSGAALYNATPSSPMWGLATSVFGDRTAAVELASTLEELEVASQEGDQDSIAALLHQARALVDSMKPTVTQSGEAHSTAVDTPPRTVTVTVTVTSLPDGTVQPPAQQPQEPAQPAPNQEPAQPSHAPQPSQAQPSRPAQQPSTPRNEPSQPANPASPAQPSQQSPAPQPSQPVAPAVQPTVVEQPAPAPAPAPVGDPTPRVVSEEQSSS